MTQFTEVGLFLHPQFNLHVTLLRRGPRDNKARVLVLVGARDTVIVDSFITCTNTEQEGNDLCFILWFYFDPSLVILHR